MHDIGSCKPAKASVLFRWYYSVDYGHWSVYVSEKGFEIRLCALGGIVPEKGFEIRLCALGGIVPEKDLK